MKKYFDTWRPRKSYLRRGPLKSKWDRGRGLGRGAVSRGIVIPPYFILTHNGNQVLMNFHKNITRIFETVS